MVVYEKLTKAGINTEGFLKRLMGNASLVRVFVNKFIQDGTYSELLEAFAAKDMKQAEIKSHTLKGMCGNMSIEPLFGLFTSQVNLIRSGEYEKAENMMSDISKAYTEAIFHMQEWLEEQN